MQKLSVIAFSRNDIDKAIEFVKYVYDMADDIVIVDSSDEKQWESFVNEKKKNGFEKLRLFHALALGYPEPLFMYAYAKCNNDWVLYLDTDERMSKSLESDINKIINDAKCDAFTLKRYEMVTKGTKTAFFTWQIHLSKKNATFYKGLLHEQPSINGKIEKIENPDHYLEHVVELMRHSQSEYHEYNKIEKFDRYSYKLYNRIVLDYVSKVATPENRKIEDTNLGKLISSLLNFYEKITFRNPDHEISNFDYFVFHCTRDFMYAVKERNTHDVLHLIPNEIRRMKRIKTWRSEPDANIAFGVAQTIYTIGITRFLELDNEKEIKRLTEKYKDQKQGIQLLMQLLMEKYKSTEKQ